MYKNFHHTLNVLLHYLVKFIYFIYLFISSIHIKNENLKHTTVIQCGLNGQHRVVPLMCGCGLAIIGLPTYKNNAILKSRQ